MTRYLSARGCRTHDGRSARILRLSDAKILDDFAEMDYTYFKLDQDSNGSAAGFPARPVGSGVTKRRKEIENGKGF